MQREKLEAGWCKPEFTYVQSYSPITTLWIPTLMSNQVPKHWRELLKLTWHGCKEQWPNFHGKQGHSRATPIDTPNKASWVTSICQTDFPTLSWTRNTTWSTGNACLNSLPSPHQLGSGVWVLRAFQKLMIEFHVTIHLEAICH